jgi:hypothetical protein
MAYVVNKDVANEPIIHDTICRWARERHKNPANGSWSPEFVTYQEAWNWAIANQITRHPRDCRVCNPLH